MILWINHTRNTKKSEEKILSTINVSLIEFFWIGFLCGCAWAKDTCFFTGHCPYSHLWLIAVTNFKTPTFWELVQITIANTSPTGSDCPCSLASCFFHVVANALCLGSCKAEDEGEGHPSLVPVSNWPLGTYSPWAGKCHLYLHPACSQRPPDPIFASHPILKRRWAER